MLTSCAHYILCAGIIGFGSGSSAGGFGKSSGGFGSGSGPPMGGTSSMKGSFGGNAGMSKSPGAGGGEISFVS